ncbi:hypothetical protein MLD38_013121 [Melastoma candidum]|uniref:Uncharacterized protein n=1 Tax=Melastoma candidum TaxID=119954 RepID=A0ACB9R7Z0_9MYRT|nr:hypothetical protein MLD38_013121 [Melastoma candidum]
MANPLLRSLIVAFFLSSHVASPSAAYRTSPPSWLRRRLPSRVEYRRRTRPRVPRHLQSGILDCYDVSLVDDGWSKDVFQVVSGTLSQSWERLDAGGFFHIPLSWTEK